MLGSKSTLAKKLRHLGRHKDNAEIIDAAYRGILGRHADQEGMHHYTRLLKKNNYDLAPILRDLLLSKEFGQHFGVKSAETDGVHREEWIYAGYRALLGREPDVGGLRHYSSMLAEGSFTLADLLRDIIASHEFRERSSALSIPLTANRQGDARGILRSEAESIFEHFSRFDGPGRPGYVTNFLGCLTDVSFVAQLDQLSGVVEGYPIPGNFHGDVLEWVGTLRSVLEAKYSFTILELGAGWGPWCAIAHAAARQVGMETIRTTGVEGDAGHVAHMRENFAVNGLTTEEGRVVFGVVGANDGDALFPKAIDASRVYGGAAAYENDTGGRQFFDLFVTGHGAEVEDVERVPCFSLKTLMSEADYVDLVHCDIQGEEARLLTSAIAEVSDKVGRIVVGTHSFEIDRQLLMLLSTTGWELEGIDVCEMREDGQLPVTLRDGTQVWRNKRFDNRSQGSATAARSPSILADTRVRR